MNHSSDARDGEEPSVLDALDFSDRCTSPAGLPTLLLTTCNPDGSVSVTVSFGGRVSRVELSPSVVSKSEAELGEEIQMLARLAQRRARAAQHAIIAEMLCRQGHDRVVIGGWLQHHLRLPSPKTVQEEAAHVLTAHYADLLQ